MTIAETSAATSPRTAPLALWRVAEAFLQLLHALFGGPERVAFLHTFTPQQHGALACWLRCAEAMLRRLLVIEAAACAKPNLRPLLRPSRRRLRKEMSFSAEAPEAWRVSFRCLASPARTRSAGGRRVQTMAARFRSSWPLAERYEALLRVFNDPVPYARRLARRLHLAPHRLAEAQRAPPEAGHRIDRFDELGEEGRSRWRLHFSSA